MLSSLPPPSAAWWRRSISSPIQQKRFAARTSSTATAQMDCNAEMYLRFRFRHAGSAVGDAVSGRDCRRREGQYWLRSENREKGGDGATPHKGGARSATQRG